MTDSPANAPVDEKFPLIDFVDSEILIHRDVHFGGQFSVMIDYYQKEGKGVRPEFELRRIIELANIEEEKGLNLSDYLIPDELLDRVNEAKEAYKQLKEIYEVSKESNSPAVLIANLILSEEEDPKEEVEEIVKQGEKIIEPLLLVFSNENYYDPLFPGYGYGPELVAKCLGLLRAKEAVKPIFEKIGKVEFFIEDVLLEALRKIGDESKDFLIKVLEQLPLSDDNEKAALALIHFRDRNDVAIKALDLLLNESFSHRPNIMSYLVVVCEGLSEESDRARFNALLENEKFPELLKADIQEVIERW